MRKFLKNYFIDFLILGGVLLLITNYFFKLTEYSFNQYEIYKDPLNNPILYRAPTRTIINYDEVGYIASVLIVIGLYLLIRKLIGHKHH